MKGNWWGLAGEWLHKRFGRISKSEVISGIPGSPADHHGTPYSLTEEFVAVYRMHPLIPDEFEFRSLDDKVLAELTFPELNALHARERVGELDDAEHALLDGHVASGRDHSAQLPALSSALRPRQTASRWTSQRSTSFALASGASRATRSSASSST